MAQSPSTTIRPFDRLGNSSGFPEDAEDTIIVSDSSVATPNYYELYGIDPSAPQETIRERYLELVADDQALEDKSKATLDVTDSDQKERFCNIQEGYVILSDGKRRQEYDRHLNHVPPLDTTWRLHYNWLNEDLGKRYACAEIRAYLEQLGAAQDLNAICIGPAMSGKTTLIQSIYAALHMTRQLPQRLSQTMHIHAGSDHGTTRMHSYPLWATDEEEHRGGENLQQMVFHDSRGFLHGAAADFNVRQEEELKALLQGEILDGAEYRLDKRSWFAFWRTKYEHRQGTCQAGSDATRAHVAILVFAYYPQTFYSRQLEDQCRVMIQICRTFKVPVLFVVTHLDKARSVEGPKDYINVRMEIPKEDIFVLENYYCTALEQPSSAEHDLAFLQLLNRACELSQEFLNQPKPEIKNFSEGGCNIQ